SSSAFQGSTNGVSDVALLWQINIFGGPALTREQFRTFVPQTFSSFHLYIGTPLGSYDPTSPINPSANRWMVSPTINYSYTRRTAAGRGSRHISRDSFSPITIDSS